MCGGGEDVYVELVDVKVTCVFVCTVVLGKV